MKGGKASDAGRAVSARLADLFANGAELVDTGMLGATVLMLSNASGDVRMGPTPAVQKR